MGPSQVQARLLPKVGPDCELVDSTMNLKQKITNNVTPRS